MGFLTGTTHALAFVPASLNCPAVDDWQLLTVCDFDVPRANSVLHSLEVSADTPVEVLTEWVANHLGYPVTLTPGKYRYHARHVLDRRTDPFYWVTTVGVVRI